jgi:hypothetical protein
MPESQPLSSIVPLVAIERRACPKCQARMMLARIGFGLAGYDHRTFECVKCSHSHKVLVAVDPMKSDTAGWLAGELKPPT